MMHGRPGELMGDRYVLRTFLGAGAYGEVWRALDTNRNHEVALKLLLDQDRAGAWREASILTALESPHILKVNNADLIVDVPYIDTELARGSLDVLAAPVGLEPQRVVTSMRRVLAGLAMCHARGLLHRDVKPANIFEDLRGDVRLGDFGVAALMEHDGTAPAHGDLHVRAPETFETGRSSVQTDVYAAAVSMYALITTQWPFHEQTVEELAAKIAAGESPLLRDLAPHVSRALAEVISTGMAVEPSRRFPSAAAFDAALGKLPSRAVHFTPVSPHLGHRHCWEVKGRRSLDVCVSEGAGTHDVIVTHSNSGRRIAAACVEVQAGRLPQHLRSLFDDLRANRV